MHIGYSHDLMRTEGASFCGACKMAATVGWESASAVDPTADIQRRFETVMESVIRVSNGVLTGPHSLWRMTPDEPPKQVRFSVTV